MGLNGLKSRCRQSWLLLEAVGEKPFPCLFQLLEAAHILGLWSPSSIVQASNGWSTLSHDAVSLILTLLLPSSPFKTPVVTLDPPG